MDDGYHDKNYLETYVGLFFNLENFLIGLIIGYCLNWGTKETNFKGCILI